MSGDTPPAISIIVPVLNEAPVLESRLAQFLPWRAAGDELIVVDGGSSDGSFELASGLCDLALRSSRGRGRQMNAGAARASGRLLWFVHADNSCEAALRGQIVGEDGWGRFDVRIEHPGVVFRIIEAAMNWRSRLTGIATGDQGIFVSKALFDHVGGYREIALMEDVELSAALRRCGRPRCLTARLGTSARRWRQRGVLRTILTMWWLRLAWWLGCEDRRLARWYGYE